MVGLLRQSLEGLKQSARVWYYTATSHLEELGFEVSRHDAGLFVHRERSIYITLHVDDCRIISLSLDQAQWAKEQIALRFEIKDTTNADRYLGMQIKRDNNKVHISQPAYIDDILSQCGMEDAKPCETPMETGITIYNNVAENPIANLASTQLNTGNISARSSF